MNGQIDAVIIDEAPSPKGVCGRPTRASPSCPATGWKSSIAPPWIGGTPRCKSAINTALNELMDDGTVDEIIAKYISAE